MDRLSNINGWATAGDYHTRRTARSFMDLTNEKPANPGSGCGSACGSQDGEEKPKPSACGAGDDGNSKPSACGAGDDGNSKPSACGTGDEGNSKPSACGSSCGSGDK